MAPARCVAPLALLALLAPVLAAQGKSRPRAGVVRAPVRGTLALGDTVRDSLRRRDPLLPRDSTHVQEWRLAGKAGQVVTIDLASPAFDAYVLVTGPGLEHDQPQDDDSGGRCNARLTVRLPRTADYFVVVTSTDKRATGPFTLTASAGARPPALAPCKR